jgi:riboflavin biosynthesis pyrimidine reductase
MAVIASFLLGANDASSLAGKSAPLSTPADRSRFLARHRSASAFIIGKESASVESYEKTAKPIFVFTRSTQVLTFAHPMMQQVTIDRDLAEVTRGIADRIEGDIVVEAGGHLLLAMIAAGVIDCLELTISPINGDGHFIERDQLLENFEITTDKEIDGTRLLQCRYKGDSAYR